MREADLPSYLQTPQTALAAPSVVRGEAPPQSPPIAPQRAPSPLAGTYKMDNRDMLAAVERARLPFVKPEPASAGGAADARREARPTVELPAAPDLAAAPKDLSGTADADTRAVMAAILRGPLPFGPSDPPHDAADVAALPLETYASVTRALAHGERRDDALGKHGLSAEAFERLAKAWAPRLQQDPQLMARFKELASAPSGRR